MQADFNPGFSFNVGQGTDDYQAPWEFKGKLYIYSFYLHASNNTIKLSACMQNSQ